MDASGKNRLLPETGPFPHPLADAAPETLDQPFDWKAESSGAVPLRILIADDNADFATSLARLVSHCGHRTQIALDGYAAVEMAQAFRPQLILVDINMPGLDGYEVCQRVRRSWWGKNTAIAAVSGMGDVILNHRGPRTGFDFRLEKPLAYDRLERLLARLA